MDWQEVCEHPSLQDLPFKIELNERGQIIMSPVKVYHSLYQAEIAYWLRSLLKPGKTLTECAINTKQGTKVADVAWVSTARLEIIKHEIECSVAPEICVEVISASNTDDEIQEKRALYFDSGSQEVWICSKEGVLTFYNSEGKLNHSLLVPEFPDQIEL